MSETGRIGPNAILQLLPVLDRECGRDLRDRLLRSAEITAVPDGAGMIPEATAARLHRNLRDMLPDRVDMLMAQAGTGTADYILAHRIPKAAQVLLKMLPAPLSARLLARAIDRHAWTFAGSGAFRVLSPTRFEIADNPLVRGEASEYMACAWHAAVFARLYQVLVHPDFTCRETGCCTQGSPVCRFVLTRSGAGLS
jgi:divinyl protochlorophyllide a 8-vinyl-reductase